MGFCSLRVPSGSGKLKFVFAQMTERTLGTRETQPPGGNRLLVVLRVESSGDPTLLISLDELSLDIRHGPGVESTLEGGSESMSLVLLTMANRLIASG